MHFVCRHIMPNGRVCNSPALRGKQFCYFHTRVHNRAADNAKVADQPLDFPVLEDRCAIQVALADVLNRVAACKLDPRRAGLILYGLQIASQNVERKRDILPMFGVETQTRTKDGDDLAPAKVRCYEPEDCGNCPHLDICEDFVDTDSEDEDKKQAKPQQARQLEQPSNSETFPQALRSLLRSV